MSAPPGAPDLSRLDGLFLRQNMTEPIYVPHRLTVTDQGKYNHGYDRFRRVSIAKLCKQPPCTCGNFGIGYIDLGIHDFAEGISQGDAIAECFTDLE